MKFPTRFNLISIRGRILWVETILIILILASLSFIFWRVFFLAGRSPSPSPSKYHQTRLDSEDQPPRGSPFLISRWIDEWLGQVPPISDAQWAKFQLTSADSNILGIESVGCNPQSRVEGEQVYWMLHRNAAKALVQNQTALQINLLSSKCFKVGDKGGIYLFQFDPNFPVVEDVGRVSVDAIGSMNLDQPEFPVWQNLGFPMPKLRKSLEFPGRTPGHVSTLVRLRFISPPAPKSKDRAETPLVLPRFRRLTSSLASWIASGIHPSSQRKLNLIVVDFRSPEIAAASVLRQNSDLKGARVEFTNAKFSSDDPDLDLGNFLWTTKFGEILKADFSFNIPQSYAAEESILLFVGNDEFDARPYWAIIRAALEHPNNNVIWARQGEPDLVLLLGRLEQVRSN